MQNGADPVLVGARSGQFIYESYCFACHDHGAARAPRLDRPADWSERLSLGRSVLLKHVEQGLGAMPRRGSCFDCSAQELGGVVDYMLSRLTVRPVDG